MDTGDTYLLTGREVCDLFRIDRRTLHEWRKAGVITGFRPRPRAHWRYRADQPIIRDARAAVRL
jgi:predicted site-specific integrase-resolvase